MEISRHVKSSHLTLKTPYLSRSPQPKNSSLYSSLSDLAKNEANLEDGLNQAKQGDRTERLSQTEHIAISLQREKPIQTRDRNQLSPSIHIYQLPRLEKKPHVENPSILKTQPIPSPRSQNNTNLSPHEATSKHLEVIATPQRIGSDDAFHAHTRRINRLRKSLEAMGSSPRSLPFAVSTRKQPRGLVERIISGHHMELDPGSSMDSQRSLKLPPRTAHLESLCATGLGNSGSFHRHRSHFSSQLSQVQKKSNFFRSIKKLSKFFCVLLTLWRKHAEKVNYYMETSVQLVDFGSVASLMFDITEYKADQQARISNDTKRILMKNQAIRTPDELRYVGIALQNYPTIASYPMRIQSLIAEKCWYERYTGRRIIIHQGHVAHCFYFILSGSVVVTRKEPDSDVSRTLCYLQKGDSFGEIGLIKRAPRSATVLSEGTVELLVFGDTDYRDIFMAGGLNGDTNSFLSRVSCMQGWPLAVLDQHNDKALMSFFRHGTVLVRDSVLSDWIYIVKSGSCSVLVRLQNTVTKKPPKPIERENRHQKLLEPVDHASYLEQVVKEDEVKALDPKIHMAREKLLKSLGIQIPLVPLPPVNSLVNRTRRTHNLDNDDDNVGDTAARSFDDDGNDNGGDDDDIGNDTGGDNDDTSGDILDDENDELKDVEKEKVTYGQFVTTFDKDGPYMKRLHTEAKREENIIQPATFTDNYFESVVGGRKNLKERLECTQNTTVYKGDSRRVRPEQALQIRSKEPESEPVFVVIQTLTKGDVFGLTDLLHEDQASFILVSNGAECMLLDKRLYIDNTPPALMHKLRKEILPYPTEAQLQQNVKIHAYWDQKRVEIMESTLAKINAMKTLRKAAKS